MKSSPYPRFAGIGPAVHEFNKFLLDDPRVETVSKKYERVSRIVAMILPEFAQILLEYRNFFTRIRYIWKWEGGTMRRCLLSAARNMCSQEMT